MDYTKSLRKNKAGAGIICGIRRHNLLSYYRGHSMRFRIFSVLVISLFHFCDPTQAQFLNIPHLPPPLASCPTYKPVGPVGGSVDSVSWVGNDFVIQGWRSGSGLNNIQQNYTDINGRHVPVSSNLKVSFLGANMRLVRYLPAVTRQDVASAYGNSHLNSGYEMRFRPAPGSQSPLFVKARVEVAVRYSSLCYLLNGIASYQTTRFTKLPASSVAVHNMLYRSVR